MIARATQPQFPNRKVFDDSPAPPVERGLDHPLLVLRVHPEDGRRTFFGYACGISCEGLRIDATRPREEGRVYELEIPLPPPLEGVAQCRCEVVWKRDWTRGRSPGMGLKFLDLAEPIAAELESWIERDGQRVSYRADAAA